MQRSPRWWTIWTVGILVLLYIPLVSVILASLANTRYLRFPHRIWTIQPYREALALAQTYDLQMTSLKIALSVAVISVLIAIPGSLAFARYDWKGRKFYQRFLLLPVFFPQSVLGLAGARFTERHGLRSHLEECCLYPCGVDRADRHLDRVDPGLWT